MTAYVLDTNFESVAVVDSFKSFIWTDRYYEAGDFELYLPAYVGVTDIFKMNYYLWIHESDYLMIIEDVKVETDSEKGNFVTITGRSLESILDRRIIWNQTNISGNMQDSIHSIFNDNIIQPTDSNRAINNFIFEPSEDEHITSIEMEAQYTGDSIYNVICDICKENKIGFSIKLNQDKQFVFHFYYGADRTYDQVSNPYVIFSPDFDNIINSNYLESYKDYKNVTLVAGEGEGDERVTTVAGAADSSDLNRREIFTDARDLSSKTEEKTLTQQEYLAQLEQRGNEKLTEVEIAKEFEGELDTTILFKYGTDFFLGDIVQLSTEFGSEHTARITEMIRSQDDSQFKSYPTFEIIE